MCLLVIYHRQSSSNSTYYPDFFERIIPAENFAAQFLRVGLFQEAFAKHGGLSENEIFFFAPALAFGGTESIQYVEKGNAVVHQHLLFEMGADHSDDTEPDDMWSQAYEANPHVFELDNGGLMVSFTFSETVDTILPVAPETLYEIEGETISRCWVSYSNGFCFRNMMPCSFDYLVYPYYPAYTMGCYQIVISSDNGRELLTICSAGLRL